MSGLFLFMKINMFAFIIFAFKSALFVIIPNYSLATEKIVARFTDVNKTFSAFNSSFTAGW